MKNEINGYGSIDCVKVSFFILFFWLFFFPVSARSDTASIVINADTGEIIHELNADRLWFPASLTKVMTLYLVFIALKRGQINLQDKIPISALAANQPSSRLGLKVGDSLTIEQAILAVATRSANDVAYALAEHQAKTEKHFALKMTLQAKSLGMSNTLFLNSSGLPNNKHVSTARDMAILAKALIQDFPQYYNFFSIPQFSFKKKNFSNYNALLTFYAGADGIKTGFTCGSGYNLMASAMRDKQRFIAIVLGAKNKYFRNKEIVSLLDQGFAFTPTVKPLKNITEVRPKSFQAPLFQLNANECH